MTDSRVIHIRLANKEADAIRNLAVQNDLDMSKMVRLLIRNALNKSIEKGELTPIPENINQIMSRSQS
jgi:hypothetical protein